MNKKFSRLKPLAILLAGVFATSVPAAARAEWTITNLVGLTYGSSPDISRYPDSQCVCHEFPVHECECL